MKIAPTMFSIFYNVFPFSLHRLVSYVIVLCFLMQTGKKKFLFLFSQSNPKVSFLNVLFCSMLFSLRFFATL